ncbi:type II toxin-antitoxin system RelE/ParE family toxin [Sphingobium aromaticiconvertens]|uniref:type II toxin-antitoxin system RelE/ParE family toxin n=1 Tax=Sphingobium aromaticiconvertens TaxID=365341 RepID=UPI003019B7A0
MKVFLTRDARNDLVAIGRHIAKDNPTRALAFVAELENSALRLGEMPRAFPLVPRYEQHGIRRRSYRGYGILYAVRSDKIVVYRFLGPGQDHDRALRLN